MFFGRELILTTSGLRKDTDGKVISAGKYTPFGHTDYQQIVSEIKQFAAGGDACVPIWTAHMNRVAGLVPDLEWRRPDDVVDRQIDVLRDDRQRLGGSSRRRFGDERVFHRGSHVGRQVGGRAHDELEDAVEE
jgi:hypothetical protein